MTKFETIIFDMDGTLIDGVDPETGQSVDVHREAWKRAFKESGLEFNSELHRTKIRGRTYPEIDATLQEVYGLSSGVSVAEAKRQLYITEGIDTYVALLPGVEETLTRLQAEGYKLALLTNAKREETDRVINKLELDRFFGSDTLTLTEVLADGQDGKPDPYGLNRMIQNLGATTEKTVFVGDTTTDMKTAKNAGISVIGYSHAVPAEELEAAGATMVIKSFQGVLTLV